MKTKMKLRFIKLFFITAMLTLMGHEVAATDLISYSLTSSYASTSGASSGTFSTTAASATFSGTYLQTSGWHNDGAGFKSHETTAFSTFGYHTIVVNASIYSQSAGVRDFAVQYKIGTGGTWTNAGTFSVASSGANYPITLPSACNNQTSVAVRWIATSYISVGNGTILSGAKNYIYAVSISGDLPATPNNQANTITFVSITPTTIRVSCTPGNGDNRIIVMNTANSFTLPTNDYNPSANSTYSGGQQVIYNGSGSIITVTVPSSTNEYWFRVFDYKLNGGMTRYITSTATNNPKLCALETIVANNAANIRLTRANLGATISPKKSTILDRGIVWSLNSGSNFDYNNEFSDFNNLDGSYSLNFPDVDYGTNEFPRSTTIYYKGYVENISGKIYSAEKSFTNVPIFSGTGTFETASLWNVQEVPGANGDATYGSVDDSPIINGICELGASNNVTNLTINSAKKLTINKGVKMQVDGTLTNAAGTSGILIKSIDVVSDASANGSLIFANGTPQGTVEMFSKSEWNTGNPEGSRYKWQYFGIPVTTLSYSSYFNNIAYVREWDESVESYWDVWVRTNLGVSLQLAAGATLQPGLAYEICNQYNRKYSFAGTLNTTDFSKTLQYSPTAYFKGQNLLSNPYTASMDIRDLVFGTNTQAAVYLYNSGTYNDWLTSSGETTPGEGPGTYKVLTPGTAGSGGVNAEIPGMQGFIVKATANPGSVSYAKAALISNTQKQRAKAVDTKVSTMIDLRGTKFSDRMWVFVDDNATEGFDNGFDGPKMLGNANVSQLYGIGTDDIYQINVLNNINNAYIGIQKGTEESFKLKFNHTNISDKYESLYLMDLANNQTVDITATGSEYVFTSTDSDPVKRFKIVGNTGTTTSTINTKNDDLKIINQDNKLIIDSKLDDNGELQIFDLAGKIQASFKFNGKSITTAAPNLQKGIYIARLTAGAYGISQRIIIK